MCNLNQTMWTAGVTSLAMLAGTAAPAQTLADTSTDALAQASTAATDAADAPFRLTLYWENDSTFLQENHRTDRHYTSGVGASLAMQPAWADGLAEALGLQADATAAGVMFGHEIYTPDDLLINPPNATDRPYAGYLYGGLFWQRERHHHLDHAQLDLGVVGPSARAEEVQKWIHNNFAGDEPQGWDSQLADEFAAQFSYRRKYRYDLPGFDASTTDWAHQVLPYAELNLGTVHRNIAAGATYRLGVRLPDDFGPDRFRDIGSFTSDPDDEPLGWSAYGFARAAVRYVQWNTFLDGNYDQNPSPQVSRLPWVAEAQAGIALNYRVQAHRFGLIYSQTWFSHEFRAQQADDSIGQLTLQWSASF